MWLRILLAFRSKKSTPGRIADFVLLIGWVAVLVCNCITLLTMGIIPVSSTGGVSKLGECTLFIHFEEVDGEQKPFLDAYGSNICIFTIIAPCLVGVTTLGFMLYHAIKIFMGVNLSCVEIIIAVLSSIILLFALSNACIITFGFISSCTNIASSEMADSKSAQACGSGIWNAITTGSNYEVFNTLNASQSSSWITVLILLILTVLYIIRGTVYYQRKKHGSGPIADATNIASAMV
ncbi:hypothetical protein LOD99_1692 [Oopsacas minuta]|uniref:Uncharacterized protein n=1 Tax=Oopsacas minuta TaxID=111878 RepID=A0AAV7K588_9METZ|nr:hypothetical protein LOD99_1692 [Oopsacas minuta]